MVDVKVQIRTIKRDHQGGIPAIIKNVHSNSAQASYDFARGVESKAKRNAHVITGRMKHSIYRVKLGYGKHRIGVGAYYGIYEEYGTRYRPPHPFFRPAVEAQKVIFHAKMRKVFER